MRLGVVTKESPRDSSFIWESESCTVERLMTVSSWSGEVVFFLGACSSVFLMDIMRVDGFTTCSRSVLVVCAAWLEVFIEGVSG